MPWQRNNTVKIMLDLQNGMNLPLCRNTLENKTRYLFFTKLERWREKTCSWALLIHLQWVYQEGNVWIGIIQISAFIRSVTHAVVSLQNNTLVSRICTAAFLKKQVTFSSPHHTFTWKRKSRRDPHHTHSQRATKIVFSVRTLKSACCFFLSSFPPFPNSAPLLAIRSPRLTQIQTAQTWGWHLYSLPHTHFILQLTQYTSNSYCPFSLPHAFGIHICSKTHRKSFSGTTAEGTAQWLDAAGPHKLSLIHSSRFCFSSFHETHFLLVSNYAVNFWRKGPCLPHMFIYHKPLTHQSSAWGSWMPSEYNSPGSTVKPSIRLESRIFRFLQEMEIINWESDKHCPFPTLKSLLSTQRELPNVVTLDSVWLLGWKFQKPS